MLNNAKFTLSRSCLTILISTYDVDVRHKLLCRFKFDFVIPDIMLGSHELEVLPNGRCEFVSTKLLQYSRFCIFLGDI